MHYFKRIFVTGDTHGSTDINGDYKPIKSFSEISDEQDLLIIAGDFGYINDSPDESLTILSETFSNIKGQIWFIDGNHENFDTIDILSYELMEQRELVSTFGVIHKLTKNVSYIPRGVVLELYHKDNVKVNIFCLGGAESVDKIQRRWKPNLPKRWWNQELPDEAQLDVAYQNLSSFLEKDDLDVVITHATPRAFFNHLQIPRYNNHSMEWILQDFLMLIANESKKEALWIFGHYHMDKIIKQQFNIKGRAVYNDLIEL